MVKNDITNQMTDAVESRAAIINDYAASAEEYMTAFALDSEVHELLQNPTNAALLKKNTDLHRRFCFCQRNFIILLILHRKDKELMAVERSLRSLGELHLSADRELENFYEYYYIGDFQVLAEKVNKKGLSQNSRSIQNMV